MNPWLVLSALALIALVWIVVPVAVAGWRYWQRPWRLVCPQAATLAQIEVEPGDAALAEVLGRRPDIARCSLWPRLLGCRQDCLALPPAARQAMRPGEAPPRERADAAIRTIVVSLDGTRAGESVLPTVGALARAHQATVRLLRVVPPVKEIRNGEERIVAYVDQETARVEAEARDYLRRAGGALPGVRIDYAVRTGEALPQIVAEAETAAADLIAVARDKRHSVARLEDATTIPLLLVPYGMETPE